MKHAFLRHLPTISLMCAFIVLICLGARLLLFLDANGSPFPFLDDWRFQNDKPFITTIFTLNNENFQVFTNALYWLAPRISLPFWGIRYISLALLISLMIILYQQLKPNLSASRYPLLLLSFAPFFSAYMATNLLWNILTQTWIFIILTLLATRFGFQKPQTASNQLITLLLLIAACLAMNISLPIIFTALYIVRTLFNCHHQTKTELHRTWSGIFLQIILLFFLYTHIRHHDTTVFSFKTLFSASYWHWLSYSLIGVWSGFLIPKENTLFYYITGIFTSLWLLFLFIRQIRDKQNHPTWVLGLILIGGMALITLFRGAMVLSITGDASRHIIYGICLIPVIYTLGAEDKNKWVRHTADIWLTSVLLCSLPTYNTDNLIGNFYHWQISDTCLMEHLHHTARTEEFTCGRTWQDLREPYQYFITHDAAFRTAYQNNHEAAAGFVPYHFEGKVFYQIPGKNFLLFR